MLTVYACCIFYAFLWGGGIFPERNCGSPQSYGVRTVVKTWISKREIPGESK
jgi:hypothetical protein